jgi:3-dehydroquinate synthase
MQRVPVTTAGAAYDVVVERGSLEHAAEHIRSVIGERRLFVVADPGAWRAQGPRLEAGLRGLDYTLLSMHGGEEHKRIQQVEALAEQMYAAGADRKCCVVTFGGGIAGDVGGFLAASYMRGVDVIQIPT